MRFVMRWLIVLAVPVILIVGGVRLATLPWFPVWEYSRPGFPPDTYGMQQGERLVLARASINFLNLPRDLSILEALRLSDGAVAFNARELSHMDDVKQVYDRITVWALLAFVLALSAGWVLKHRGEGDVIWGALSDGGLATLLLFFALGLLMVLSWRDFFVGLHHIFFEGDSWLFLRSDTLIRLFPERFWRDAGFLVAASVSSVAFALALFGRALHRRLAKA